MRLHDEFTPRRQTYACKRGIADDREKNPLNSAVSALI